jgi:hypothetical protein
MVIATENRTMAAEHHRVASLGHRRKIETSMSIRAKHRERPRFS